MSHQATIIRLEQLALEIKSETAKILPGGIDTTKFEYRDLKAKITGWEQAIKLVQRDMKSQSNFNHMIHAQDRGSYSAGQRLKSGEQNIKQVSQALDKVIDALAELTDHFFGGDNPETRALKGIAHALKNWSKTAKNTESGIIGAAPPHGLQATVQQAKPFLPPGTPGMAAPAMVDVMTIVVAYILLVKTLVKKK